MAVAIMIGLQGSGKSTFYTQTLKPEFVRVNLDTLKTRAREKQLVEQCIHNGDNFAVDNTNPTKDDRARYIVPAKAAGYRVVGYFMESKLQECIKRNAGRTGKARVPDHAIAATSNQLQMPS